MDLTDFVWGPKWSASNASIITIDRGMRLIYRGKSADSLGDASLVEIIRKDESDWNRCSSWRVST